MSETQSLDEFLGLETEQKKRKLDGTKRIFNNIHSKKETLTKFEALELVNHLTMEMLIYERNQ